MLNKKRHVEIKNKEKVELVSVNLVDLEQFNDHNVEQLPDLSDNSVNIVKLPLDDKNKSNGILI